MADLPFIPARPDLADRLTAAFDAEGKIARAVVALAAPAGRDVALLGSGSELAARLGEADAHVVELALPAFPGTVPDGTAAAALAALDQGSVGAVVAPWSAFGGPSPDALAAADRALGPDGRLVVLQDYGRDDLDAIRGPARTAELVAWSRRDGWYLRAGFRIHVVHAFWAAETLDEAAELLDAAYGAVGREVSAGLRRPRIAHNVAIYHRVRPA